MNESSGSNPFNRGNTRNSDRNLSGDLSRSNNSRTRRPYDRQTVLARRRDRKQKQRAKRTWGNSSFHNDNRRQNRNYSSQNRRDYYRRDNQMGGQHSSGMNQESNGTEHFHWDAVSSGNIPQNDNNIGDKPQSNPPDKPEEAVVKKTQGPKKLNENILANMTDKPDNVRDIVLNIKKEKDSSEKSKKDDEDSDSDDSSDDSTLERLRKTVNNTLLSKPKGDDKVKKIVKKKEPESSSDSSSSSSDSDEKSKQKEKVQAIIKKKISSEEEVICLGKMERIENLVEDEDELTTSVPQPIQETESKSCLLCDQEGHAPIQCFMICKNCNASYHGMRDCPKPPNMSLMLQYFMQFCLDQCCKYNPAEKFNVNHFDVPKEDNLDNSSLVNNISKLRTRRSSIDAGSSVSKQSRKRRSESSSDNSETSSEENSKRKRRRRRKSSKEFEIPPGMPFNPTAYNPAIPFPFNPSSIGFNPLMAFNQMMAYNNPNVKRSSGKSRKSK